MNWARIFEIVKGFAAVSGIMAFVGFGWTFYQDYEIKKNAINQGWQEAEIYRVLLEAGNNGLIFDEIVSKVKVDYFSTGLASGANVNVAQDDAVRRGLIGLAEKNSVVIDVTRKYFIPTVARGYISQDLEFAKMQGFFETIFNIVESDPGKFTSLDLRRKLVAAGATPREAWQAVESSLFMLPAALVPADGTYYRTDSKLKVVE